MLFRSLNTALEIIREHNDKATVITTPWEELDGKKILETIENAKDLEAELMAEVAAAHDHEEHHHDHHHGNEEHHHDHGEDCTCGCHNQDHDHEHHHGNEEHHHDHEHEEHDDHHGHGEDCTCGCHDHDHHHHHADEIFTSWGFETPASYTQAEVEDILDKLEDEKTYGAILRAKGMVSAGDGTWVNFDYVPGESDVREGTPEVTGKICVIGSKLNEENLKADRKSVV